MFDDAQALALEFPETFACPDVALLAQLKLGDAGKVCTGDERFWAIIEQIDQEHITARIDNELHNTDRHGLRCDDVIQFEKKHIYQVYIDEQKVLHAKA